MIQKLILVLVDSSCDCRCFMRKPANKFIISEKIVNKCNSKILSEQFNQYHQLIFSDTESLKIQTFR
jgi:hypothetical protein